MDRLKEMSEIPILDVDPNTLTELDDIKIDGSLPVRDRILSLIEQTENPYVYKDKGVVVKIGFTNNGKTLQDRLEEYLATEILLNR